MEEQDVYRTIVPVLMETEPGVVLRSALEAFVEVSGAARGCLVIPLGEQSGSFALEHLQGDWPPSPSARERVVSHSILERALTDGRSIVIENALEDPGFMHQESVVGARLLSVMAIPLWSLPRGPRPVAAIYLDEPGRIGAFEPELVESVEAIAEMLGPRIEQAWRYDRLRSSEQALRDKLSQAPEGDAPVGGSACFQRLLGAARQVAVSDVPLLLLGESGTGKEVLARYAHELSPFSKGPLVSINCGALPGELLESELFGHERGAFTGATNARVGKIGSAASGTLFLDEVGEMSPSCQTRFLRVLQTGEIQRVGSDRTTYVKFRLIAATNQDLRARIEEGLFREDLYYRLAVVPLTLPTLAERGDDILLLAQHFLCEYARSQRRAPPRLAADARGALVAHGWPGNVRELENAMRRALVFATGDSVALEHLPPELGGARLLDAPGPREGRFAGVHTAEIPTHKDGLEESKRQLALELERRFMTAALERSVGNLSRVSRETGFNRAVLYDMLKRLELDPARFRDTGEGAPSPDA